MRTPTDPTDPTDRLSRTLRTLDPAAPAGTPRPARAADDLRRILATGPAPRRPRRVVRRLVVAGGLVTAVTAAVVVVPSLAGGDRAFATWSPTGEQVTAAEADDAAAGCREAHLDSATGADVEALHDAVPAVAETRGAWTTVLLVGDGGFSALCVTDGSTRFFRDWVGSIGRADVPAVGGARDVVATDLGTATLEAGELSLVAGAVDTDVVSVSYDSPTRGVVQATVAEGHFALWLPGDDLEDAPRRGVELDVVHTDGSPARVRVSL